jgi:hypothetical protein
MIQDRNLLSMEAEEKVEWQTIGGSDDDVNTFVVA